MELGVVIIVAITLVHIANNNYKLKNYGTNSKTGCNQNSSGG